MNKSLVLLGLLLLLEGCTSVYEGMLFETAVLPREQYAVPAFARREYRFPISWDFVDCPDGCQITCCGVFGGREPLQQINLRGVFEREFAKMVRQNFARNSGEVASRLKFRVQARQIDLKRDHYFWWWNPDVMNAKVQLKVTLFDPENADREPVYEQVHTFNEVSDNEKTDSKYVPACFYKTAVRCAKTVISDIANNSVTMDRLKHEIIPAKFKCAEFKSFELKPVAGASDINRGHCQVLCNDEEGSSADEMATAEIPRKCANNLGIKEENVRVVYKVHQLKDKSWNYEFAVFPRRAFVFQYDAARRHGHVIVDPDLAHLDSGEVSHVVNARILEEMKKRNGVFSSLNTDTQPRIRLGSIKTNATSGLVTVEFDLVY